MAAVTLGTFLASGTNGTSFTTASFTPAANDLLCVFVGETDGVVDGTVSSSAGTTFTRVVSYLTNTSADKLSLFVANALSSATSQTITFDCTGDTATAGYVGVLRVSGMTRTGLSAILQYSGQANQAASGTPAPAFSASALTGNPTIGAVFNRSRPSGMTEPSGWTERGDNATNSPNSALEFVSRDSGFTGTTITWGSSSATGFASLIAELDTSAALTSTTKFLMLMGCGT